MLEQEYNWDIMTGSHTVKEGSFLAAAGISWEKAKITIAYIVM